MDWSARMNAAVDYIEANLAGALDLSEAAKTACCSTYHFQRMFFAINGLTPADYARRRKLTLAATELSYGGAKVIDVATKYGYDSPSAFTRAFRNQHGVNPQAAREPGIKLTAYPRVSFHIELKGGSDMDYRIIEKPAFEIIGVGRKFTAEGGANFIEVPKFWQEFMATPDYAELMALCGDKPGPVTGGGCLGCCLPNEENGWEPFIYAIAVEKPAGCKANKFETFTVQAATWAVFDCNLDNLQDVTKRIYSEWFPSTGYEHELKPDLEVYFPENPVTKVMPIQIWEPVAKKG